MKISGPISADLRPAVNSYGSTPSQTAAASRSPPRDQFEPSQLLTETTATLLDAINDELKAMAKRYGHNPEAFLIKAPASLAATGPEFGAMTDALFNMYARQHADLDRDTLIDNFQREVVAVMDRGYEKGLQLLDGVGAKQAYGDLARTVMAAHEQIKNYMEALRAE